MDPRDVVYVSRDGTIDTARYDREATAAILNTDHGATEVFAIQMICGRYEVYALSDIKFGTSTWCKGPPRFTTPDYDAALTWAILMCGQEP